MLLKIKELRKKKGLTIEDLANKSGISKRMISAYEAGTNDITLSKLQYIAQALDVPFYSLVDSNITEPAIIAEPIVSYGNPSILPIVVDKDDNERIPLVKSKAAAGYIGRYMEPEFISKLPSYNLPGMMNATFRMFEITGHSMLPTLHDGDIVVTKYVEKITDIRNDRIYVIVTNDNLLVKRVILRLNEEKLVAKSDNIDQGYPTINLDLVDVREIWYVKKKITGQFPNPTGIFERISNIEADLSLINEKLKK